MTHTNIFHSVCFGDLVLAACDSASCLTNNHREASRLAARTVGRFLGRMGFERPRASLAGLKR